MAQANEPGSQGVCDAFVTGIVPSMSHTNLQSSGINTPLSKISLYEAKQQQLVQRDQREVEIVRGESGSALAENKQTTQHHQHFRSRDRKSSVQPRNDPRHPCIRHYAGSKLRLKMWKDAEDRSNYYNLLMQTSVKLGRLDKQIKALNRFRHTLHNNKKVAESANEQRKAHAPELIQKEPEKTPPCKKGEGHELQVQYKKAVEKELDLRQKYESWRLEDERRKENRKNFTQNKIKKVKLMNKHVQQVYIGQRKLEVAAYDEAELRRSEFERPLVTEEDSNEVNVFRPSPAFENTLRESQQHRCKVQRNRLHLEEEFQRRIDCLIQKRKKKQNLTFSEFQLQRVKSEKAINRASETQHRRQCLEQDTLNRNIQKIIQKQQKSQGIGSSHKSKLHQKKSSLTHSNHFDIDTRDNQESLRKKERAEMRRTQQLRNLSDQIHNTMEARLRRLAQRQHEIENTYNAKTTDMNDKYRQRKNKLHRLQIHYDKLHEELTYDRFRENDKRKALDSSIERLKQMSLEQLKKQLHQDGKKLTPISTNIPITQN